MEYLSDLWVPDPNKGRLYQIIDDTMPSTYIATASAPRAVLVDINMVDVWVVNSAANSISKFTGGARVKDIMVGKTPMGIAQNADTGAIYVTNFKSNTVSKILEDKVVKTIPVGIGPRGIVILDGGAIYITCYLASVVCKIVDDTLVKNDIQVGLNPYGICVDKFKNVWVANAGSNTVSKITGSEKVLDLNVGRTPQDVCSDKNGLIYVSNYTSNTVSVIEDSKVDANQIPVGKGPFAIGPSKDGFIYVFNYLDASISKINARSVILTIGTCNNPCPFGDFTGYKTYLAFEESSSTSKKVSYTDLDASLQQIIASGGSGTLVDSSVLHDDLIYPTVKAALDHLLYTAPQITSFTNTVNTVEIGSTINSVILNWAVNKTLVSQTINNGVGDIPVGTVTKQLSALNLTADTTWTLTAVDSQNTVTKSTSVNFRNKRYWGVSTEATLNNAAILALNSEFATGYAMTKDLNASGGKYLYFAVPTSFGLDASKFKIGGLANSDWVKTTVSFTNASGYATSYDIFRSGNIQTGSAINVVVG